MRRSAPRSRGCGSDDSVAEITGNGRRHARFLRLARICRGASGGGTTTRLAPPTARASVPVYWNNRPASVKNGPGHVQSRQLGFEVVAWCLVELVCGSGGREVGRGVRRPLSSEMRTFARPAPSMCINNQFISSEVRYFGYCRSQLSYIHHYQL